jgi:hypothetical protein
MAMRQCRALVAPISTVVVRYRPGKSLPVVRLSR